MKNKIIIAGVLCAVVFSGVGFYGGLKYQREKDSSLAQNLAGQRQRGAGNGAGNFSSGGGIGRNGNGGVAIGQVIAKDDKSITIKLRDGGSKIVFYSSSIQLQKMTDTPLSDLIVGKQVTANGTVNLDGSLTANQIQIRPEVQALPSPAGQ